MSSSLLYVSTLPVDFAGLQHLLGEKDMVHTTGDAVVSLDSVAESDALIIRIVHPGNVQYPGVHLRDLPLVLERFSGRVLILAEHADFFEVARLVGYGVRYFATLDSDIATIQGEVARMQSVEPTKSCLHQVRQRLLSPWSSERLGVALTARERQVAAAICCGLTNRQIATLHGISYETVKEHVQHILRKFEVKDRTEVGVRIARVWDPQM